MTRNQKMFEDLFRSIEVINDLTSQVATAAEEQTQVAEDINANVQHVSSLSDQTLDDIQRANTAIESMAASFTQMTGRIAEFRIA